MKAWMPLLLMLLLGFFLGVSWTMTYYEHRELVMRDASVLCLGQLDFCRERFGQSVNQFALAVSALASCKEHLNDGACQ